jgi:hypothetical protein
MKKILSILKIGDCIFIGLVLIGFVIGLFLIRSSENEGQTVSIFLENRELYRLLILEDRIIVVQGKIGETVVKIEHGKVCIESAPCPHQLCKNMGRIYRSGESIVCIPNRLLIRIEGSDERSIDSITM